LTVKERRLLPLSSERGLTGYDNVPRIVRFGGLSLLIEIKNRFNRLSRFNVASVQSDGQLMINICTKDVDFCANMWYNIYK